MEPAFDREWLFAVDALTREETTVRRHSAGAISLIALLTVAFGGWLAAAGRATAQEAVERNEPPGAERVQTVRRVLRGVLTFDRGEHQSTAKLASAVEVDKCVVTLSDAIVRGERDYGNPRGGAIVAEFSETRLTVWTDEQHTRRLVSYQIIEYH